VKVPCPHCNGIGMGWSGPCGPCGGSGWVGSTCSQLPTAALDGYAEYRRWGGRFDLDAWWNRYKGDYKNSPESVR
jgi:hypothetical protein